MPTDESGRAIAEPIEEDHPRWLVQFGPYSRDFLAVARFGGPRPLRLDSKDPNELVRRMREVELHYGSRPDRGRPEGQANP
jgi:hypothetical protein